MSKRLPFLLLALVAAGALGGYLLQRGGSKEPLTLYGNVDIREVDLAFRVGGRLQSLALEEGDAVAAGARLAVLDPAPLDDALAVADAAVTQARANLAKFRAGARPQELRQAEAGLQEARSDLERSRREQARQQTMMADEATSERALDEASTRLEAAQARVAAAEASLELLVEGFRAEDVAAAEAQLELALAQRRQAARQVDDGTLTAPAPGTVLTRIREVGSILQPGQPVYTLSLDRPVRVRAYVDEPQLGALAPGTEVLVYTDSREAPYAGQVGFVSPRAEFTPKNVETEDLRTDLVYRLRIVIADPDDKLRQGMPVTVRLRAPS